MHELHDHSSFADARSHALDRAVTHISDDEDTPGTFGFEQTGIAIESRHGSFSVSEQVRRKE